MFNAKPFDPTFPVQQQPGIDSGPTVLVNASVVNSGDQNAPGHYPSSAVAAPHLFEKNAIPNCCVA